ncbi:hypothetical protein TNCV_599841 [Trichonephila clavipes]|nr:hypothetical protein TNCV_599841 [Trichonephila clavipes]
MPVISDEDLIARISVAAGRIRDMPGIFRNVRNSMQHSPRQVVSNLQSVDRYQSVGKISSVRTRNIK